MNNAEIADLFDQLADLLELEGANAFRVRAYRSAARTIDSLADSLADLVAEDPALLQELPGIGKDLAGKIVQILRTGGLEPLDELKQRIPADVVTMLRIPGLGPKKVAILFHELHLKSLDELKLAAEQGLISQRKGFGKKTEESILEGLQQLASTGTRLYLADAKPFADRIVAELLELKSVEQASSAGRCAAVVKRSAISTFSWRRPVRRSHGLSGGASPGGKSPGTRRDQAAGPLQADPALFHTRRESRGTRNGYAGCARGKLRGSVAVFHRVEGTQCGDAAAGAATWAQTE
ncbi:MAG: helix-hairpin-helix domain-containing protein [Planctomycetaceae bacterium]